MLYTATTFKYVFDYHPGDVYWCTADVGWITGHSYVTYGPMGMGATSVMVSDIVIFITIGLWYLLCHLWSFGYGLLCNGKLYHYLPHQ